MAFATVSDLATWLPDDLSAQDTATAQQALEIASQLIRSYLNLTVDRVEDDVITIRGENQRRLILPEYPIVEVSLIELDGIEYPSTSYEVWDYGVINKRWGGAWWWFQTITVTYSHGWDPIPDDIKGVCLELASRMTVNSSGSQQISIGSYSESWGLGGSSMENNPLYKIDGRRRLVPA